MDSPYRSPEVPAAKRSVTLVVRSRLVIPQVCVCCGDPSATFEKYTQDHAPFGSDGPLHVQTTNVEIPYCKVHADRFRSRFKRLRFSQLLAFVVIIVGMTVMLLPEARTALNLSKDPTTIEYAITGAAFLFLIVSIFMLKPLLYDVFVTYHGNQIRIKGAVPAFNECLIAANREHAQEV